MDRHSERFRNHISIVAEQLGRGLWFVGAVAVGGVVQNVREAAQLAQLGREAGGAVLQGLLVALVFRGDPGRVAGAGLGKDLYLH